MNNSCIFLGTAEKIKEVYGEKLLNRMSNKIGIDKDAVFTEDMLENGNVPKGVTAVFGTWGFPALGAEKIKEVLPDLKYVFYAAGSVKGFAEPYFENGVRIFSAAAQMIRREETQSMTVLKWVMLLPKELILQIYQKIPKEECCVIIVADLLEMVTTEPVLL